MKAQDLQPGHVVRIAFNHTATVNATEVVGDFIRVEWEEPYEDWFYPLEKEMDDAQ